ncbi:MAG TPA: PEP-CTERM sorting domain-containing protein [Bryobacteraceae bacterium]
MNGIVRFCKGLESYKRLRRLLISGAFTSLGLIGFCGVARSAVVGCPDQPITLAAAEKLIITFDEMGDVPQFCSFTIKDFALLHHGNIIFKDESQEESDRFVFVNTNIGGVNQATFCFASDPDLGLCVKDHGDVDDIIKIEDGDLGSSLTTLFQGENGKGLSVTISSDGNLSNEKNKFCSDTLTFGPAPKVRSDQSEGCPCQQCAMPEPGTLALLGLGIAGMAFMSRRLRKTPFTP